MKLFEHVQRKRCNSHSAKTAYCDIVSRQVAHGYDAPSLNDVLTNL